MGDTLEPYRRHAVQREGWRPGSSFEDRVALMLSSFRQKPGGVAQQHRVGRYRVDFAWPELKIALECDGWWHESPDAAAKDATRDKWLRSQGWLVFRINDADEELLEHQVARVVQVVNALWHRGRL